MRIGVSVFFMLTIKYRKSVHAVDLSDWEPMSKSELLRMQRVWGDITKFIILYAFTSFTNHPIQIFILQDDGFHIRHRCFNAIEEELEELKEEVVDQTKSQMKMEDEI